MSIEAPARTSMYPVAPDGDALLSLRGSMTDMMQTVADRGMLADGGFAMTDGTETAAGFNVVSDQTGEHMRAVFATDPNKLAAFDAWTERAKFASSQLELPGALSEAGRVETITSDTPKLIALNARGELGKVNLLAIASANEDKIAIVEKDGQAYTVRKFISGDKIDYMAHVVENGSTRGLGRTDIQLDLQKDVSAIKLTALDADQPINLEVMPTFEADQSANTNRHPRLRGVLKGIRGRKTLSPEVPEFDLTAADQAIANFKQQTEADAQALRDRDAHEQMRKDYERIQKEAVSIKALSAEYPLAGNLFVPGASIFEDPIFNEVLAHHKVEMSGDNASSNLTEALKRPVVRSDIAKVLRYRLNAWCDTEPAREVEDQLHAKKPLDQSFDIGDPQYVKNHYPADSLIHYASTNKRTIANMRVPDGVKRNGPKSPNAPPEYGHPAQMNSRDYVVNLALAKLEGAFNDGRQDNITHDVRFTDAKSRVVIHKAHVMQHRTAANLILYGDC